MKLSTLPFFYPLWKHFHTESRKSYRGSAFSVFKFQFPTFGGKRFVFPPLTFEKIGTTAPYLKSALLPQKQADPTPTPPSSQPTTKPPPSSAVDLEARKKEMEARMMAKYMSKKR
jgi:hypothetical protein